MAEDEDELEAAIASRKSDTAELTAHLSDRIAEFTQLQLLIKGMFPETIESTK